MTQHGEKRSTGVDALSCLKGSDSQVCPQGRGSGSVRAAGPLLATMKGAHYPYPAAQRPPLPAYMQGLPALAAFPPGPLGAHPIPRPFSMLAVWPKGGRYGQAAPLQNKRSCRGSQGSAAGPGSFSAQLFILGKHQAVIYSIVCKPRGSDPDSGARRKVLGNRKMGPWGEKRTASGASCSARGKGRRAAGPGSHRPAGQLDRPVPRGLSAPLPIRYPNAMDFLQ